MGVVEKRKAIERKITRSIVERNSNISVYNISRGRMDRVLSFSPGAAYYNTSSNFGHLSNAYGELSREMHSMDDERKSIEKKIEEILEFPLTGIVFSYLNALEDALLNDDGTGSFEVYGRRMRRLSEEQKNTLLKLINKWSVASQDCHYKMTKQEKRKLLKMMRRS